MRTSAGQPGSASWWAPVRAVRTLSGLDLLLYQSGWSVQVLDRLAAKRDGRAKPDLLRKRVPLAD